MSRNRRRLHVVQTPEGLPLTFEIATAGERLGAFFWDLTVLFLWNLLVTVICGIVGSVTKTPGIFGALLFLFFFLSRTFYFAWYELRWQGATPGKRRNGIRVIDARGGPLRAESVLARNFLRELEVFAPATLLLFPSSQWPDAPRWAQLGAMAWLAVIPFFLLFNKARMRIADVVAGTRVVRAPVRALQPELARPVRRRADGTEPPRTVFTAAQLETYGIYELQMLEEVLRTQDRTSQGEVVRSVAAAIQRKIGHEGPAAGTTPRDFLLEFYAAQRSRLENLLLLGKRKERQGRSAAGSRAQGKERLPAGG